MIRKKAHIFSLLIAVIFIHPTVVTSIHVLLHHSKEEYHNNHLQKGYSKKQFEVCQVNHFAFEAFFLKPVFVYQPISILSYFKKVFEKRDRLFCQITYLLKERSPPLRGGLN